MKTEVRFDGLPAEVKKAVEKYVKQYLYLLPTWCHLLHIQYQPMGPSEEELAAVSTSHEYRQAEICIYARFLEEPEHARAEAVAHEMLHVSLAPLADYARSLVERLTPDDTLRNHFVEEITARMEGAVVDLTYALTVKRS